MKQIKFLGILLTSAVLFSCGTKKESAEAEKVSYARILFYNVENLFDTLDTEGKSDSEYTPESNKQWNTERYNHKLSQLSKVILTADTGYYPDIIGFSEIENRNVVEDLINSKSLKAGKYSIIHQESPDQRGIDLALVHNKNYKPIKNDFILVDLPGDRSHTRDIIYSKGVLFKDTVHIFINHWPSRYGGKKKSDPKRAFTAQVLRSVIDSIQAVDKNPRIIITGDFNDYPPDSSLYNVLKAKENLGNDPDELINLAWKANDEGSGSYNYKDHWGTLDQFIVSANLFAQGNLQVDDQSYIIVKKDWMLYTNDKGKQYPSRTYGGKNYYGGYSDHLPILLKLKR